MNLPLVGVALRRLIRLDHRVEHGPGLPLIDDRLVGFARRRGRSRFRGRLSAGQPLPGQPPAWGPAFLSSSRRSRASPASLAPRGRESHRSMRAVHFFTTLHFACLVRCVRGASCRMRLRRRKRRRRRSRLLRCGVHAGSAARRARNRNYSQTGHSRKARLLDRR